MKTHADAAYDNRLQFKHNFEVWAHLQDFPDTLTTKATSLEFYIWCHCKDQEYAPIQWTTSKAVVADLNTIMRESKRERESERFYWRFNATKRDATEAHIIHGYTCQGWRNPKERLKKEEVIQLLTHSRKRLPKNSFIADANLEHLDVCLRPARRMSN